MRIGLNVPDSREISTDRASTSSASNQSTSATPQVDKFSGDTVSLSSLAAKTLQFPEIRQDKVDSLRQMIANGEYQVDPHKTAGAILSH